MKQLIVGLILLASLSAFSTEPGEGNDSNMATLYNLVTDKLVEMAATSHENEKVCEFSSDYVVNILHEVYGEIGSVENYRDNAVDLVIISDLIKIIQKEYDYYMFKKGEYTYSCKKTKRILSKLQDIIDRSNY